MHKALDFSNIGQTNRHYSDEEERVIRLSLSLNKAELHSLGRRVAQLNEEIRMQNIALAPHKRLPDDVLSCIFTWCCCFPASFPLKIRNQNPALTLCQVCSRWRLVALQTRRLWTDVKVDPGYRKYPLTAVEQWLIRGGSVPRSLELTFERKPAVKAQKHIISLLSQFPLRKIVLSMSLTVLEKVIHKVPAHVFLNVEHLELKAIGTLTTPFREKTRLPSLVVLSLHGIWDVKFFQFSYPWPQLRRLDAAQCTVHYSLCLKILRDCSLLEHCALSVSTDTDFAASLDDIPDSRLESNVQDLHLKFKEKAAADPFIHLLVLPSVLNLSLYGVVGSSLNLDCRSMRFADMARRSKMGEIKSFTVAGCEEAFDAGAVLRSMPSLESLRVNGLIAFDEETLDGLATGTICPGLKRISAIQYHMKEELEQARELRKYAKGNDDHLTFMVIRSSI